MRCASGAETLGEPPAAEALGPSSALLAKPFSTRREALQKPRRATLLSSRSRLQITGFEMIALILNAIYRQYLRISISGAKAVGRWV